MTQEQISFYNKRGKTSQECPKTFNCYRRLRRAIYKNLFSITEDKSSDITFFASVKLIKSPYFKALKFPLISKLTEQHTREWTNEVNNVDENGNIISYNIYTLSHIELQDLVEF